jgi:hypothetical protein
MAMPTPSAEDDADDRGGDPPARRFAGQLADARQLDAAEQQRADGGEAGQQPLGRLAELVAVLLVLGRRVGRRCLRRAVLLVVVPVTAAKARRKGSP